MAVAYTDLGWDYVKLEATARRDKRGLWAGSFVEPSDWRKADK